MSVCCAGCLLLAFASVAQSPASPPVKTLSFREFSDWHFAYNSALRAFWRGDLEIASLRFRSAIAIARPAAESDPRPLARTYTDFALVLLQQGRARDAEPLAEWALKVREERFGKDSLQASSTVHVLALLASAQTQFARSEALLGRALAIWEKELGPDHPRTALGLLDLATLYSLQRKYQSAEVLFRRILEIPQESLSNNHAFRAISLIGLGSLYVNQGEFAKAESTDRELVAMLGRMGATTYGSIASPLADYLGQLRRLGQSNEAETLEAAARAARTGQNAPSLRLDDRVRGPFRPRRRST
jgi:tetratricopeptide (TPR) repeat protein